MLFPTRHGVMGLMSLAVLCVYTFAQQSPAQIPPTGHPGLDQYRASRIAVFTDDFGQLARYREADATLKPPAPGENRVVFFGDSITDMWKLEDYFPGKPYINRGIGGQTTPQMLVRFRQDVIDLHPKVVLILAGTNDIAGNTGPMSLEDIEANYSSMAELARAHNIRVALLVNPSQCTTTRRHRRSFFARAFAGEDSGIESLAEGLLRRHWPGYISTTTPPWLTKKGCSNEIWRTTVFIQMPPDSRSWRRWRKLPWRRLWRLSPQ